MKIKVVSDLHLEFSMISIPNNGADVLILAGDIFVADHPISTYDYFLNSICNDYQNVIYVMGNHEHYGSDFIETYDKITDHLCGFDNIHLLNNQSTIIDGVPFIGSTLWTSLNSFDPLTMLKAKSYMNDFELIHYRNKKFMPDHWLEEYVKSIEYIEYAYNEYIDYDQMVVVTHHAPSFQSMHRKYADLKEVNGCFYSNLDLFIMDRPKIALWAHGHTHHGFDYMIGNTGVVCNPRGYAPAGIEKYENQSFDMDLLVEI